MSTSCSSCTYRIETFLLILIFFMCITLVYPAAAAASSSSSSFFLMVVWSLCFLSILLFDLYCFAKKVISLDDSVQSIWRFSGFSLQLGESSGNFHREENWRWGRLMVGKRFLLQLRVSCRKSPPIWTNLVSQDVKKSIKSIMVSGCRLFRSKIPWNFRNLRNFVINKPRLPFFHYWKFLNFIPKMWKLWEIKIKFLVCSS